jgi:hypothetical protein
MRPRAARRGTIAAEFLAQERRAGLQSKRRRFHRATAFFLVKRRRHVNDILGVLIGIGPVVGALLWRGRQDRLRRRANHVRADISAAANRVLGGESVLSVHVEPRVAWRTGRVHLSAPGGYEFLIASVSGAVIARLPAHYELVVDRV